MSKLVKLFFFFSFLLVIFGLGFSSISFARIRPPILPVSPPVLPTLSIPKLKITLLPIKTIPLPIPNIPKNKMKWSTPYASLEADDFYIIANGRKFLAKDSNISVHSDPGDPQYTSLEMIWHEKGVEMRLFIYFTNDGQNWWSDEFRTYNGMPYGDWIYYYGKFFTGKMGNAYQVDKLDLSSSVGARFGLPGRIHFENLKIQTFFKPQN